MKAVSADKHASGGQRGAGGGERVGTLTELEIKLIGADVVGGGQQRHHHHGGAQRRQQPVVRRDAVLLHN